MWYQNVNRKAGIIIQNENIVNRYNTGNEGYVWIETEGCRLYSYYYSSNDHFDAFNRHLEELDISVR